VHPLQRASDRVRVEQHAARNLHRRVETDDPEEPRSDNHQFRQGNPAAESADLGIA